MFDCIKRFFRYIFSFSCEAHKELEQEVTRLADKAADGSWIDNNGDLKDFFSKRHDKTLPIEERRKIAKAFAHRYGIPYIDPAEDLKAPTRNGMDSDGNQQ